ncbi:MAG: SDR family NAD(P)-dependent oxidoreductase [Campylobacterota bacterium]
MQTAIVTGVSSGIGKEIARQLLQEGYYVIGLSRQAVEFEKNFEHIAIDLTDTKQIESLPKLECNLLVNAAGIGYFQPLETMSFTQINNLIDVNLKAPILLTNKLLRTLRDNSGHIINLSSIEATRSSRLSSVYSATKSGLTAFSNALFEEVRKQNVKCTTLHLGMTKTNFFDALHFECSDDSACRLEAHYVAQFIAALLQQPKQMIASEITLQPQKIGVKKK